MACYSATSGKCHAEIVVKAAAVRQPVGLDYPMKRLLNQQRRL